MSDVTEKSVTDARGRKITLRILDPWPPQKGARSSVTFFKWLQSASSRTCRVFHK